MLEIAFQPQCIFDRNVVVSRVRTPNIATLIDRFLRVSHPELAFDILINAIIQYKNCPNNKIMNIKNRTIYIDNIYSSVINDLYIDLFFLSPASIFSRACELDIPLYGLPPLENISHIKIP